MPYHAMEHETASLQPSVPFRKSKTVLCSWTDSDLSCLLLTLLKLFDGFELLSVGMAALATV